MHHKFLFTLAGIFLLIAFVVPAVLYTLQASEDVKNYSDLINDPSQVTSPNSSLTDPSEVAQRHTNTTITVIIVEVVFISLFVVFVYLGISHYHGQLDKPKVDLS